MAEPSVSLDSIVAVVRPTLMEAGFEDAGSGESGPYTWARFRRQERQGTQRHVRMITISHAPVEQAFVADVYLVSRTTYTQTPVQKDVRRYGTPGEAESAARELAALILGWVGA